MTRHSSTSFVRLIAILSRPLTVTYGLGHDCRPCPRVSLKPCRESVMMTIGSWRTAYYQMSQACGWSSARLSNPLRSPVMASFIVH
ncbi:hypothetical protein LX36DRAFT_263099 [Colletotrichum falcatum]|nr:hypothetical protein LX36DRAFT_263099 [Colletotrichum falcatum]